MNQQQSSHQQSNSMDQRALHHVVYHRHYPGMLPTLYNGLFDTKAKHYNSPAVDSAVSSGYKILFMTLGFGFLFDRYATKLTTPEPFKPAAPTSIVLPAVATTPTMAPTAFSTTMPSTNVAPLAPAVHMAAPTQVQHFQPIASTYYRPLFWFPPPAPKLGARFPNYAGWPVAGRVLGWSVLGLALFNSVARDDRHRFTRYRGYITHEDEVAYANSRLISHR